MNHCCTYFETALSDASISIRYLPKFREYGILVADGGTAHVVVKFCPWCGAQLPEPLRDQWFDRVEALGLEPDDQALPPEMQSDEWWTR